MTHPLTTIFLVGALCAAIAGAGLACAVALAVTFVIEGVRFYAAGKTDGLG